MERAAPCAVPGRSRFGFRHRARGRARIARWPRSEPIGADHLLTSPVTCEGGRASIANVTGPLPPERAIAAAPENSMNEPTRNDSPDLQPARRREREKGVGLAPRLSRAGRAGGTEALEGSWGQRSIERAMAKAIKAADGAVLAAVSSPRMASAEAYAKRHARRAHFDLVGGHGGRRRGGRDLRRDPHQRTRRDLHRGARGRKHVLGEKPAWRASRRWTDRRRLRRERRGVHGRHALRPPPAHRRSPGGPRRRIAT